MIIPPSDARDFFRIIKMLDAFFTKRLHMLRENTLEEINRQRVAGFASPEHLQAYVKANPDKLSAADLATVASWQENCIAGRFLIHIERKDGCLFARADSKAEEPHIYLVKGLTQPISELVPFLPCFAAARLLPFRGHIITDGLLAPMMVHIGSNTRTSFAAELKETLATRGLITTLPAGAPAAVDWTKKLNLYLSTPATRRASVRQIQQLRQQSPEANLHYLRHTGKLHAKTFKASLKAKGLTGHFAVLEDTIIAGAPDKPTATACVAALLPPDLQAGIVWIKL